VSEADTPTPFDADYYVRAQVYGQAHAALFSDLLWASIFLGACRTREQYEEVLHDVDDIEKSAAVLVRTMRVLIAERLHALSEGNGG
jgi:hypothetical protein